MNETNEYLLLLNFAGILIQGIICFILYKTAIFIKNQAEWSRVQVKEEHRGAWIHSFSYCVNLLQDPEVVKARGIVFEYAEKSSGTSLTTETTDAIDLVCRTYDVVGMIAQWGMVPKEIILDSWCDSIRRIWPICEPRVQERRNKQKAPEFWDDFEWLYREAQNFDQNRVHELKKVKSIHNDEDRSRIFN